jgi:glycosyltransferase 2 family protein
MTWAGNFASQFLWSTIGGDALRVVGIFRYTDRKTVGIGSVALDRIINMAAMACLLPVPVLVFGASLEKFLSGAALAVPMPLQKLLQSYFPKIGNALRTWASRPWSFVYAFLAAWPSNLLPMAATYLIARQLDMDVSFWQVVAVQTVAYFVTVLPVSVNGFGLRETIYASLYTALGTTLEQASTLALVTRFLTLLVTVPGAFWLSGAVTDAALNKNEIAEIES